MRVLVRLEYSVDAVVDDCLDFSFFFVVVAS